MTQQALALFGINSEGFCIQGGNSFRSPGQLTVEGDWSNGTFFLAAQALGSDLTVDNLSLDSAQGDKAAVQWLAELSEKHCIIPATDIPDLVPILAVVAGQNHGARFTNIQRLRLKETDRVATVCDMIRTLGATAEASEDTLDISPAPYHSCTIHAQNDHRIAMSAAIAATVASGPVTILNADCVSKSHPRFWEEYHQLGGHYEQYIR